MSTSFTSNFDILQDIIDKEENSAIKGILCDIKRSGSDSETLFFSMPHLSIISSGIACEKITKLYMLINHPSVMEKELKTASLEEIWMNQLYIKDWTSDKKSVLDYKNLFYLKGEYNFLKHSNTRFKVPKVKDDRLVWNDKGKLDCNYIKPSPEKINTKEKALRRSEDAFNYLCTALKKSDLIDTLPRFSTPPELSLEGNDTDPETIDAILSAIKGLSEQLASQEDISGVLGELNANIDEIKDLSKQFDSVEELSSRISALEETLEQLAINSRNPSPPAPVPVRKLDEKKESARKKREKERIKREKEKKRSEIKTPGILAVITLIAVYLAAALIMNLPLHEKYLPALLNTWLKQYVLWGIASFTLILTLLFALKRVKEVLWCLSAFVLFALLMMWPTVLGVHGLIKDMSYSYNFTNPMYTYNGGSVSPNITPLLCSHARMTYESSNNDVIISPYGKVTLSENGKDAHLPATYTTVSSNGLKAACSLVVDNTAVDSGDIYPADKNGLVQHTFGDGERDIILHRWIYCAKVRDEEGEIPVALTKLKIEAQRKDGEWIVLGNWDDINNPIIIDYDGCFDWEKIGKKYNAMTNHFRVSMRLDGYSGDDIVVWETIHWLNDSVEILDDGSGY